MEITKFTKRKETTGLRTINQVMVALGEPHSEVYVRPGTMAGPPRGMSSGTLYVRKGKEELMYRATELHKEGMIKHHPDRHQDNPEPHDERCKQLGEAFQRAKHLLKGG